MMWFFILGGMFLGGIAAFFYLINGVRKFKFIEKLSKGNRRRSYLYGFLLVGISTAIVYLTMGGINTIVVLIHFFVFWVLVSLVFFILKKFKVSPKIFKPGQLGTKIYLQGVIAVLITILYLGYGFFMAQHVFITEYSISTDKNVEPLRIVQFSDSHIGTTFDGKGLAEHIETINALEPDIVLITGDFIDGSSKDADIRDAIEALSGLKSTYGTYFCFGNHDKNAYGEENLRQIKTPELGQLLEAANVTVLEDETVEFAEGYTLIGRKDKSENRLDISSLVNQVNEDNFIIDMNHQPNDYANEQNAGVDLVLSGHTHGGQFFPIIEAGVWMKANDKTYGYEKRGETNFIVSSGISDWALNFKTGCFSEIVVIEVGQEQ